MKYIIAVLIAVVFASCASYKPPVPNNAVTEKTINKDIESVFKNCNLWMLENNFSVTFKDKNPYQIIADGDITKLSGLNFDNWSGLKTTNAVADCGTSGILTFYPTQAKIILILDSEGSGTKVKCKISFSKFNPEPNPSAAGIIQCVSTGIIEATLFKYLENK